MTNSINIILHTIIILIIVLFSDLIDNYYNHIWLALIYTFVYISCSCLGNRTPFLTYILISIILDSIYGMNLGFSALIFIIFACCLKVKNYYIKQLGTFLSHGIFIIALGLVSILAVMSKYILGMNFVSIGYYILFSVLLYPCIYLILQTLLNILSPNEK